MAKEIVSSSLFASSDLKAYWRLEGNANDSKGSFNGSGTNVTYGTNFGRFGQGGSFTGSATSQIVASGTIVSSLSDIGLVASFYVSSTSMTGCFLYAQGIGIGVGSGTFEASGNNLVLLYETIRWIDTGIPLGTGWHTVVVNINSSGHPEVFLDGLSVYTDTGSAPPSAGSSTYIGGLTSRWWGSYVDDVAVVDRPLTTAEVKEVSLYQRQWRSDDADTWDYGFGNGQDGDLTISSNTTEAPIDASCTGNLGELTLTATNASFQAGQLILIHQSRGATAGRWELNKISNYSTGTITLTDPLQHTYIDSSAYQAQVRVIPQYNNVTINSGITYTVKAWDGNVGGIMAFAAKGVVQGVSSSVISLAGGAGASGTSGNPAGGTGGGFRGGMADAVNNDGSGQGIQGEGTLGAGTNSGNANGNGGGAARGTADAPGAGGGNGTAGTGVSAPGGSASGGSAVGNAALTRMFFGGGAGGATDNVGNNVGGGGAGGGILLILTPSLDLTNLSISLNGGNGGGTKHGGGGGAGGSALFKVINATFGTNKITATGGTNSASSRPGGAGGVGRVHVDYSGAITGSTNPTLDSSLDATIITPVLSTSSFSFFM